MARDSSAQDRSVQDSSAQDSLPLGLIAGPSSAGRGRAEIAPGAVHLPGWLTLDQQRDLVAACREWAAGPVPMRHTRLPTGAVMSVQTVCLGWHWSPYKYTRTAAEAGGLAVAAFPPWLADLGRAAVADAYGSLPDVVPGAVVPGSVVPGSVGTGTGSVGAGTGNAGLLDYRPDTALINFYDAAARMGMHQDKDEKSGAPVVSLSIGDTCRFRFGNVMNRNRPYTDVELRSGDLFVFGGPSRFAFHGVPKIHAGTGDPRTGLTAGRLNLTLRDTGLTPR